MSEEKQGWWTAPTSEAAGGPLGPADAAIGSETASLGSTCMSGRLLLLHGLEDARSVMLAVASEAGYQPCPAEVLGDVMLELQRGDMAGVCVESAGPGSLDRIVQGLREMPEALRPYLIVLDESANEAAISQYPARGPTMSSKMPLARRSSNCICARVSFACSMHSAGTHCTIR